MKELDTTEQISAFTKNALDAAKELYGDDIKDTDFTVIQPYANGQGMILRVGDDENGERATKLDTIDTLTILPAIDAVLDIYEGDEADYDAE
ncbi:hypothetical protein [Listeria booriae]|uniref:hypothetical protein n=1 Tax=Listeria booriae TaxID=1552123 RepID=UPI00162ADC48|nr:hypothetical protein [Listeria booriae]MBC2303393.1 hypothetical protein [Listeria booriae]MBC6150095.1 hypothetical protein [Listeria booriae]